MTTRPSEHSDVDVTAELVVVELGAGVRLHMHQMTLPRRMLVDVLDGVVAVVNRECGHSIVAVVHRELARSIVALPVLGFSAVAV